MVSSEFGRRFSSLYAGTTIESDCKFKSYRDRRVFFGYHLQLWAIGNNLARHWKALSRRRPAVEKIRLSFFGSNWAPPSFESKSLKSASRTSKAAVKTIGTKLRALNP